MSNPRLICLVYASRRPASPADPDQQTRDILIASIGANRMVDITGLLVIHEDWFLQALEGPEPAVMQTYTRIQADPRHCDQALLMVRDAAHRLFPRWSMCAQTVSGADQAIIRRLVADRGFDPFTCPTDEALGLLTKVADLHGQLLSQQYAELEGEVLLGGLTSGQRQP